MGVSVVIGEMAHIVAEESDGPRGKSPLSKAQRNSYANLILLCPTHHTRIDKVPTGALEYPVEVLHDTKVQHEEWVRESLGAGRDPDEMVYASIIDHISTGLDLKGWSWWVDNAVRGLLPFSVAEAAEYLKVRRTTVIWPGKYPELDTTADDVMRSFVEYVEHFEELANLEGNFLREDVSFKQGPYNSEYKRLEKRSKLWRERNFLMLCRVANNVNCFSQAVRDRSIPSFYRVTGKFLVIDSMDVCGRGTAFALEAHEIEEGLTVLGVKADGNSERSR